MDKNEFFRQAALRICGNLEIEEAMQRLLQLLKEVMPVTKIFLQYYDHDYNAMRSIAYANETECGKLDLLTPLSKVAQETAGNVLTEQDAFLFEDPQAFPISREMFKFHNIQATSLIVMLIRSKEILLGSLVLITEGEQKFKDEHLKLLLLLKEPLAIAMSNTLKHREILKLKDLCADDNRYLHGELRRLSGDEIIGTNFGLKDVMEKVQQVATLDSPVLLLGETGVGKDVIANAIHYSSSRSSGSFVSVNCGAIPDTLIDSELFGHEKGAFTGAIRQEKGCFEIADKGTLFLDEVSEIPIENQTDFLRVLEDFRFARIGGNQLIEVDVRIVSATNNDLKEKVKQGLFREDLFYRLHVVPLYIPPLRERRAVIPKMVDSFMNQLAANHKKPRPSVTPEVMEMFCRYDWPGNVRELKNLLERVIILNNDDVIDVEHLPSDFAWHFIAPLRTMDLEGIRRSAETKAILDVLYRVTGDKDQAAKILGISPRTLRYKLKRYNLKVDRKGNPISLGTGTK